MCADHSTNESETDEIVYCIDCATPLSILDAITWTPYDYNPAGGDLPTYLCSNCLMGDEHLERILRNQRAYELDHHDPEIDND